jgi:hypothetical protein
MSVDTYKKKPNFYQAGQGKQGTTTWEEGQVSANLPRLKANYFA